MLTTDDYETSIVDWRQKMDDCMREAGFDLGDPSTPVDTSQFDMDAMAKASAACTITVGEPPVDPNQPTEDELFESQLIFATCMREAGYDYPDPVKGDGGMTPAFGPDVDSKVVDACSAQANKEISK